MARIGCSTSPPRCLLPLFGVDQFCAIAVKALLEGEKKKHQAVSSSDEERSSPSSPLSPSPPRDDVANMRTYPVHSPTPVRIDGMKPLLCDDEQMSVVTTTGIARNRSPSSSSSPPPLDHGFQLSPKGGRSAFSRGNKFKMPRINYLKFSS